jgi:predicted RNase H-like HicB family nuclease
LTEVEKIYVANYEGRIYRDHRSCARRRLLGLCPEVPGTNGQGENIEEAKESLHAAIQMILADC